MYRKKYVPLCAPPIPPPRYRSDISHLLCAPPIPPPRYRSDISHLLCAPPIPPPRYRSDISHLLFDKDQLEKQNRLERKFFLWLLKNMGSEGRMILASEFFPVKYKKVLPKRKKRKKRRKSKK